MKNVSLITNQMYHMCIKKLLYLVIFGLFIASCGGDEEEIPNDRTILSYDGENLTAPTLPEGLFEFAVRFPPNLTRNVEGRSIEQVSFYLYDAPAQMYLNISTDFTTSVPGDILNTQMISNPRPNSWNTITLDEPYPIDGGAIWVGIEVNLDRTMQSVGCDAGPANANGDWLYQEIDQTWDTFRGRTGESVNWNIKAIISE